MEHAIVISSMFLAYFRCRRPVFAFMRYSSWKLIYEAGRIKEISDQKNFKLFNRLVFGVRFTVIVKFILAKQFYLAMCAIVHIHSHTTIAMSWPGPL